MKKEFKFSYDYISSFGELSPFQQKAICAAEEALETAYVPYSNYKVGAALLLKDNSIISGSNQENIAYPSGLCAERVALFSYGAAKTTQPIKILAIVGSGNIIEPESFFSPCGACRQVIAEYSGLQDEPFEIVLRNNINGYTVFNEIKHLLPFIFGSK